MKLKEDVKPITFLKNNAAQLIRKISEEGRTVMITQNGEAKAVLMDVGTYDRWRDAINLMKIISHGDADITSGRTVTQAKAFERAAKAIEESSGDA